MSEIQASEMLMRCFCLHQDRNKEALLWVLDRTVYGFSLAYPSWIPTQNHAPLLFSIIVFYSLCSKISVMDLVQIWTMSVILEQSICISWLYCVSLDRRLLSRVHSGLSKRLMVSNFFSGTSSLVISYSVVNILLDSSLKCRFLFRECKIIVKGMSVFSECKIILKGMQFIEISFLIPWMQDHCQRHVCIPWMKDHSQRHAGFQRILLVSCCRRNACSRAFYDEPYCTFSKQISTYILDRNAI